jgi:16S rRNA (adenine1518-N6/adenine1519-N6)-dimethyltransferase
VSIADLPLPNKRLGQNFLIDPNIVRKIVALAELGPGDHVLEIGPGRGVLTEALSHAAGRVTAVEVDPRLHAYLETRQTEFPNVELVCEDVLAYPVENLPMGTVVVANLPYYISTPVLFRLLDQRGRFPRMVLMLQAEVADRLVAKPGDSDYGVLSVMAQYAADITKSFRVSAQCFRPRPEVASAVVLLRAKEDAKLGRQEEAAFRALVKAAFAHRRKTLVNSLRDEGYELHRVTETLERLDIVPARRAETLSVEDFLRLAAALG